MIRYRDTTTGWFVAAPPPHSPLPDNVIKENITYSWESRIVDRGDEIEDVGESEEYEDYDSGEEEY